MKVNFVKMQGAGNDYIFIDCAKYDVPDFVETAKTLSDRHFSVGGDGVIYIFPSDVADAKMRIFNSDGTEGKMCGNGIRCAAKYVYENVSNKKETLKIETMPGIKDVRLFPDSDGRVSNARVNMGKFKKIKEELVEASGKIRKVSLIDMGNLHAVLQVDNTSGADISEISEKVRKIKGFSETNVE
ncbi:MAG: diaminopimelate epimerase, partial [Clostridiales bacterium]|nr:diaminopimelate epimerase [Clostridiales bacterium]